MSNILYHPNIEFKDKDYQWLIRASLFWDNIYRIVPENYTPQDSDNIKALSDGGIIRKVSVKKEKWELDNLRHEASNEFLRDYSTAIEQFGVDNPQWREDTTRFSTSKAHYSLMEKLDELGLVIKTQSDWWQNDWVRIPKFIGDRYMSYFARYIAEENNMSLATSDSSSWLDASNLLKGREFGEEEVFAFPISINDIVPETIDKSPKEILKFREKRKDEREHFNKQCEEFAKRLSQVSSLDVLKDIWNDECKEIENAVTDYKKSMDILNVTKFVGGLSFIGSVIGNILGYTNLGLAGNLIGSLCFGLDSGIEIMKIKSSKNDSGYSYLYDVQKFATKGFGKKPIKAHRI